MQTGLHQHSMRMLRVAAVVLLAASVMFSSACKKKKPNVPAATAPPKITAPEPQPAPPTESTTTIPNPEPTETTTVTPPAPKPKPKRRLSHKPKPPVPPPAPQQQTQQAKNNSGDSMTISPDLPKDELDSQKRETEQFLQTAEANLRKLNRQLSDGEQNMARQVRNYI